MNFNRSIVFAVVSILSTGFSLVEPSWAIGAETMPAPVHNCEYLLNPGVHQEQIHFEEQVGIKTPQDVLNFWRAIDRAVASQKYSWQKLCVVDYARPSLRIRDQFTQPQVDQLFQIFSSLRTREHGDWEKLLLPVEILFKPDMSEKYFDFENDISEYAKNLVEGNNYAKDFNYATVTALSHLPQEQRKKMRDFFFNRIQQFRRTPPLNKFTRRNAEVLYRALYEIEFQEFLSGLVRHTSSRKMDTKFATQRIELFWRQMSFGYEYDFSDVFAVAQVIQNGPLAAYMGEGAIYLYGSFPNGTAAFPKSDIDIHLSPNLEKLHEQTFGYDGTFAKPEGGMNSENLKPMQKAFFDLERSIAGVLGVKEKFLFLSGYTPGQFLTVSTGSALFGPKDWFSPKYMSQQSPIMLKITRKEIILQVFDAYSSRRLYEVELH